MSAQNFDPTEILSLVSRRRGMLFAGFLVGALLAFEMFNYSTTEFALTDLLGDLKFAGLKWSTILALAFCGIDFAGIARLFTPKEGNDEPGEVWYLFGAWLLAATMNALLTWWGVSIALLYHDSLGNAVVASETLLKVVPVFVAIMVWLSRVLIIGTFSVAGERLFTTAARRPARTPNISQPSYSRQNTSSSRVPQGSYRPSPAARREPTYEPAPMMAKGRPGNQSRR
ncbi:MAG: hypothetical protein EPO32_02700 [Anaerolineae bacterium]|nr:MAG: hypothetical protein EPO32_02700 [Anaerolineae bacterium]